MIIAAIIFGFVLRKTRVGRYTYAIGSNEEASRLSGIKVTRIKLIAYMIMRLLRGLRPGSSSRRAWSLPSLTAE